MVYDINNNSSNVACGLDGNLLEQAYDINKNPLLSFETDFKVMSYNVGSWTAFGASATSSNQETWYTLQNDIISSEAPDFLGIQEYDDQIGSYSVPVMIKQYLPYLFGVDKVSGKAGRALASKRRMKNSREVNFQNQNGEQRSYLITDIFVNGKTVKFLTAHLALDKATIILQIQELLSTVNNYEYWILTGDFNINFPSSQSEGYNVLIKPFLDAGYNVANGADFGFIPTFSTKQPGDDSDWRCLDNIMCSSNIDITNVYVNRKKITDHAGYGIDHLPLIAEVVIN